MLLREPLDVLLVSGGEFFEILFEIDARLRESRLELVALVNGRVALMGERGGFLLAPLALVREIGGERVLVFDQAVALLAERTDALVVIVRERLDLFLVRFVERLDLPFVAVGDQRKPLLLLLADSLQLQLIIEKVSARLGPADLRHLGEQDRVLFQEQLRLQQLRQRT